MGSTEKNVLEILIKQILKIDSEDIKQETEISKEIEKIEDISDSLNEKTSDEDLLELTEETYDLFMQDNMPEFYKLNVHYGSDVFEGYYESTIESVKKTKATSFSAMACEYESETLHDSLTLIKDVKEHKYEAALLLDSGKKACVDSYKWRSVTWWQMLYELQGKVIF